MIGTIGDITCFSFYATKTLTTGEGGMITTAHEEWAERIKRQRLHGITKDAWNRYSDRGSWEYDILEAGYKYNMTDIASAIGIEQLKKSDSMNLTRRNIADKYLKAFSKTDLIETWNVRDPNECAWHLFPIKLNLNALKINRDQFIDEMQKKNIGTSVHYIPLYRFSIFADFNYSKEDFKCCEDIFLRQVSLPIYPKMSSSEIDYVIDKVLEILEGNKR
jgi:perosamine synthetase